MAAEWGSLRGQSDYLPMASGLRLVQRISVPQASLAQAMVWTVKAVVENGNATAAAYLAIEAEPICNNSVKKHRQALNDRRWAEFEKCTGLTKRELFDGSGLTALSAYFDEADLPHVFGVGNGWSILHYAVLSGSLPAVKFLVETLNADVRILSWHSETPLDIAIASDIEQIMDYLITRHANCRPKFQTRQLPTSKHWLATSWSDPRNYLPHSEHEQSSWNRRAFCVHWKNTADKCHAYGGTSLPRVQKRCS